MQTNDRSKESPKTSTDAEVEQMEKDPAVERGERIQTGKQIARSGKDQGRVPGAESNSTKK